MFKFCALFCAVVITTGSCAEEDALQEFSRGNEKFIADLVELLARDSPDKAVISSLSARIVLSVIAQGANGETDTELRRILSLPNRERTASAVKSLLPLLEKSSNNFTSSVANKLYIDLKFEVLKSYQNVAVCNYHSGVEKVNFTEKQKTDNLINKWVESKTNNTIKDLIKPDENGTSTVLVLGNTLHLNGKWVTPFAENKTSKKPFYSKSGNRTNVDTMESSNNAKYLYFHCGFLKAKFLEILYQDSNVSMTFVLPDARDGLSKLERGSIALYLKPHNLTSQTVAVSLPKFSLAEEFDLKEILTKLGVSKVFNRKEADLSEVSGKKNLFVNRIKQKVFLSITETGTGADAATAVGTLASTSTQVQHYRNLLLTGHNGGHITRGKSNVGVIPQSRAAAELTFNADHPFFYFIRESKSNAILFIGRYS